MDHYFGVPYFVAFFWGLAVLLGFIGLGRLVARAIGGQEAPRAGWGLHAVWGIAGYLFLGGCLATVHCCTDFAITLLILAGLANWLWTTARGGWPGRAGLAAWPWQTWPLFAFVALCFVAGVAWQLNLNSIDDFGAYYTFCEKLLVTGSFDDPFSWRRLASLGGHTLLQGSVVANSSFINIQLFEIGLSPIVFLGLLIGFRGGALVRSRLGIVLALVAISTPIFRINTASHYTGVILFMGLFVTLDYFERADVRRRWLLVTGLVAAALCSLRAQDIAAAGGTLAVYWIVWWLRDRPPLRRVLVDGCWCAGALLVALLPWMLMSYRSNQSLLFPLFAGGNNLAFNPLGVGGVYEKLKYPVMTLTDAALFPLFLCLVVRPPWREGLAVCAVTVAGLGTSVILAYGLGLAGFETIVRYVQPLVLVAAMASLATAALQPRWRYAVWVLLTVILVGGLDRRAVELRRIYQALGFAQTSVVPYDTRTVFDYRQAQMLIPPHKRVLICADFPALFDHARNELWNVDLAHGASPAPGLPYRKPAEETKQYLRRLGVEYLILTDFEIGFGYYSRTRWEKEFTLGRKDFEIQAPFYIDFFDTGERLAASEKVLGKHGLLTVIQLQP